MLTFSAPLPYIGELHVLLGLILKINSNTLCRFSFKTEPKKALFLNLQKCHEVFTCSNTLTKSPALGPVLFCLIRPLNVEKCLTHWPSATQIKKWVKTISQRASTALFSAGDSFRHVSWRGNKALRCRGRQVWNGKFNVRLRPLLHFHTKVTSDTS